MTDVNEHGRPHRGPGGGLANVVLADEINRATAVGAPALFIYTWAAWMGPASLGVETFAPTVGKFAGFGGGRYEIIPGEGLPSDWLKRVELAVRPPHVPEWLAGAFIVALVISRLRQGLVRK